MNKEFVDELYHQLRELNLGDDIPQKEAITGIVSHLLNVRSTQGDYTGLLRFLSWYGEKYLLQRVYDIIHERGLRYSRVVELGAGFGWLGRGIARLSGNLPTLFVDKRQWPFTDIVADIETEAGRARVGDEIKPDDLIVMSEFIHCLDDPVGSMSIFGRWPMIIVEYNPVDRGFDSEANMYKRSYYEQIVKFSCKPGLSFEEVFPNSCLREYYYFPHMVVVAKPKKEAQP